MYHTARSLCSKVGLIHTSSSIMASLVAQDARPRVVLSDVKLKKVEDACDRSSPNVALAGEDNLAEEEARWKYFFDSGANSWFNDLKGFTFTSVRLSPLRFVPVLNACCVCSLSLDVHDAAPGGGGRDRQALGGARPGPRAGHGFGRRGRREGRGSSSMGGKWGDGVRWLSWRLA